MRLLLTTLLLIAAMLVSSCTKPFKETHFVPEQPEFKLIIAADRSDFKDNIRLEIIEKYRYRATIEQIPINSLRDVDIDSYDAVLIMDTRMAWTMFNHSLKAFLRKAKDKRKVVFLITAANKDWQYSYRDVDAITSASIGSKEGAVFSAITEGIDNIVASPPAN